MIHVAITDDYEAVSHHTITGGEAMFDTDGEAMIDGTLGQLQMKSGDWKGSYRWKRGDWLGSYRC